MKLLMHPPIETVPNDMVLFMTQRRCIWWYFVVPFAIPICAGLALPNPDGDVPYAAPDEGRTIWPAGLDQETASASYTRE